MSSRFCMTVRENKRIEEGLRGDNTGYYQNNFPTTVSSSLSCLRQLLYCHHGIFITPQFSPFFLWRTVCSMSCLYHSVLLIYFHICDDARRPSPSVRILPARIEANYLGCVCNDAVLTGLRNFLQGVGGQRGPLSSCSKNVLISAAVCVMTSKIQSVRSTICQYAEDFFNPTHPFLLANMVNTHRC